MTLNIQADSTGKHEGCDYMTDCMNSWSWATCNTTDWISEKKNWNNVVQWRLLDDRNNFSLPDNSIMISGFINLLAVSVNSTRFYSISQLTLKDMMNMQQNVNATMWVHMGAYGGALLQNATTAGFPQSLYHPADQIKGSAGWYRLYRQTQHELPGHSVSR